MTFPFPFFSAGAKVQTQIPQGTGTPVGNMTSGGGLAAAFDGNTNQNNANSAYAGATATGYIGKNWGAGNDKVITGFKAWGSNNLGFESGTNSVTIRLIGHTSNDPGAGTDLGSITFTDTEDNTVREKLSGLTTSTAYQYHWLKIETSSAVFDTICAEAQFFEDI